MPAAIEQLIKRLASEAKPVRRLHPPMTRAALWLLAVAVIAAAGVLAFADFAVFGRRIAHAKLAIEMAGSLLTGIAAVTAAFHLSLPDRARAWALLPLPGLALWLAGSCYSCYRHWLSFGPEGWTIGESANCFRFILAVSLPLGVSLLLLLRRAQPLAPLPVAAMGGLGVAAIAAFLLQFFHPFDVTVMDLAVHAVAVALVVLAASAMGGIDARRHPAG